MLTADRHIAIQAGWVAGPAFGVAMMAAPEYLHLGQAASADLFWGGIAVFLATIAVVVFVTLHEEEKRRMVIGPIVVMAIGALTLCGGAAWYFWPRSKPEVAASLRPETATKQEPTQLTSETQKNVPVEPIGSTFFRLGPGAVVEGLKIQGAQVDGFTTDFDINGHLKDPSIRDFKSSANNPNNNFTGSRAHVDSMYIGKVSATPPAKIGHIQPMWPINRSKNADGSITEDIPVQIDEGVVLNLTVDIEGSGLIKYEVLKDGATVPAKESGNIRIFENAKDLYVIHLTRRNEETPLRVGLGFH
jgi:hypothetical protein